MSAASDYGVEVGKRVTAAIAAMIGPQVANQDPEDLLAYLLHYWASEDPEFDPEDLFDSALRHYDGERGEGDDLVDPAFYADLTARLRATTAWADLLFAVPAEHADTLYGALVAIVPNTTPHWAGGHDYDSADVAWGDAYMIITRDDLGPGYLLGLYTTEGWMDTGECAESVILPDAAAVSRVVGYLTENQPEGTDFVAWAAQRLADDGAEVGLR